MGMILLDRIVSNHQLEWEYDRKSNGYFVITNPAKFLAQGSSQVEIVLYKPETFMNLSGKNVSKAMNQWKIPNSHLCVVHDDLERKLGKLSVKNGIQMIALTSLSWFSKWS
jgi:PTH1 family peptidyl-tRNA hydrolase